MTNIEFNANTFVPYERPPELSACESFKRMIWDSEKKLFLRRTFLSWIKILGFFTLFYSVLACLFAVCLQGLYHSLSEKHPTYMLDDSIIGANPGLGFRPISEDVEKDGAFIWYRAANTTQCDLWTGRLDTFLKPYQEENPKAVDCSYDKHPEADEVCKLSGQNFGPCSHEGGYSYNSSSPCIFIKLNKIYNWRPEFYKNAEELPDDMPESLKDVVKNTTSSELNNVWLSCVGENPADRENIGPVEYFPRQGFPGFFYPYLNNQGYLSPIVAVRLAKPTRHVLINIECRAWAKNIRYTNAKNVREGSVHLEVQID